MAVVMPSIAGQGMVLAKMHPGIAYKPVFCYEGTFIIRTHEYIKAKQLAFRNLIFEEVMYNSRDVVLSGQWTKAKL